MRKFLVEDNIAEFYDPQTGEITMYSNNKSVQLKETEPFFLTYSKQILALYSTDVLNATTKVLYKMMEFAEWNSGKVYMAAGRVEEIMSVCCISRASYHRAIKELLDKGVITKEKGCYIIAENMFWKGEIKARDKILNARMKVSFSPVFSDNIEKSEKEGRN